MLDSCQRHMIIIIIRRANPRVWTGGMVNDNDDDDDDRDFIWFEDVV